MELRVRAVDLLIARGWRLECDGVARKNKDVFTFTLPEGGLGQLLFEEKAGTTWTPRAIAELRGVLASFEPKKRVSFLVVVVDGVVTPECTTECAKKIIPRVQVLSAETVLSERNCDLPKRVSEIAALEYLNGGGMPIGALNVKAQKHNMWQVRADDISVQRSGAVLGDVLLYDADDFSPVSFRRVVPATRL